MTDIKHLLISGAKSRKYRQRLASVCSSKLNDSMLTVKFKLDTKEVVEHLGTRLPSFLDYTNLYNEIEGVNKGSFTYLLFSVILSGFRLFSNSAQSKKFFEMQTDGDKLPELFPKTSAIAFDNQSEITEVSELAPYLVVAKILARRNSEQDKSENKYVKDNLTTFNNNALSWLFGAGLKFLKTSSVATICKAYNIPDNKIRAAELLKDAADAIPAVSDKFSSKVAALNNFRSCFGGHIDSWVSNYISRLKELDALLSNLPDSIVIPPAFIRNDRDFIEYSGLKRDEIDILIERVNSFELRSSTIDALHRLLGVSSKGAASERDVVFIREFSEIVNRLCAVKESLDNTLSQAEEDRLSEWNSLKKDCKNEWQAWSELRKIPKINKIGGGVPDVKSELEQTASLLAEIKRDQEEYYQRLMKWVKQQIPDFDPFTAVIKSQQEKINKISKDLNAEELAVRLFLHKIGNTVRRVSDRVSEAVIRWFAENNLFETKKDFNKFFYNKQGAIYVSPFSRRNQNGFRLVPDIKSRGSTLLKSFEHTLNEIKTQIDNSREEKNASDLNTVLLLDTLLKSFYVSGIQQEIPSEIARPILPDLPNSPLSASLKISLEKKTVNAGAVASIFTTAYKSLISGCYTVLNRDRFFLRTKFQWINNHSLYYVPKDNVGWKLPERYLKNEKWQRFIDDKVLVVDKDLNVDIAATFENMTGDCDGRYADLLVQLPHDWYFNLPIAPRKDDDITVNLELCKDNYKEGKSLTQLIIDKKFSRATACRLIGPSSFKHRLDEIIISGDKIKVSEMTMLVDMPVDQRFQADGTVDLSYGEPVFSIAVPISREAVIPEGHHVPFKRIVAIDQGEAGLAYAVFNLDETNNAAAKPIATGTIRLPSIRRLIGTVNTFRKRKSTTQKFSQRFDSTMFNLRKNVAGDVCGAIVGLMQRFNAFPVLERDVSGLESGSNQLKLVYKAVNAKFLLSDVDMQNSARGSWWFNPNKYCYWETDLLREVGKNQTVEKKKLVLVGEKRYQRLIIYPGVGIRAAGTSQICSCCRKNAFDILKKIQANNPKKKFHINSAGEVTIEGEVIKLYHRPDNKSKVPYLKGKRSYNAINERAPWTEPEREHDVDIVQLRKLIKANMRRAPKSMLSKDTSQSRYYCVFKNCSWHNQENHADINAAINIGRRFLSEVIRYSYEKDL